MPKTATFAAALVAVLLLTGCVSPTAGAPIPSDDEIHVETGYDIFLLMGQSNMSGWSNGADAHLDTRIDPSDPRVYQYSPYGTYADTIVSAVEPLGGFVPSLGVGPGLYFGRWYADSIEPGRRVLLVTASRAATGFEDPGGTGMTWTVGRSDLTNLTDLAIDQAQKALTAAGPGSRFAGVLWHQGETDAILPDAATTYPEHLDTLITTVRESLDAPDLPFVVGQMVPDYLAREYRTDVNRVQSETPDRVTNTAFALAEFGDGAGDLSHFNIDGQRANGLSMFEAYRRILEGVDDPALPKLPGAVTGMTESVTDAGTTDLSWEAVSGAKSYYVESSVPPYSEWTRVATSLIVNAAVPTLDPATGYMYRVRAVNSAGAGPLPKP